MNLKEIHVNQIDATGNIREIEDVGDLAESIRKYGLLQPIVVQKIDGGRYRLIDGHRRRAAVEMLGEPTITAIINDEIMDRDTLLVRLSANIQRQEMTPGEIVAVIDQIKSSNMMVTDAAVCRSIGKPHNWLSEIRKAAKAYEDLVEAGVSPASLKALTKMDLVEVGKHDDQKAAALKLAGAVTGTKTKVIEGLKHSRPRQVKASYMDRTGGFSVSTKNMLVRVLCDDPEAQKRVLKALYALKADSGE